MIQGRLVSFAREHGVATEQNTRLTFEDCKERKEPDIVFYPGICPPIQTDVTVINPCAPSWLSRSSGSHNWAIKTAMARKTKKYRASARAMGHSFTPLAFETHGKMDREVKNLLLRFAARTSGSRGMSCKRIWLSHSCGHTLAATRHRE